MKKKFLEKKVKAYVAKAEKYYKKDLKAQREMAESAKCAVHVAIVEVRLIAAATAITTAGAIFAYGAWQASERAVAVARETMERELRPWVIVQFESVDFDVHPMGAGDSWGLVVEQTFDNFGSSPAINTVVSARLLRTTPGAAVTDKVIVEDICDALKDASKGMSAARQPSWASSEYSTFLRASQSSTGGRYRSNLMNSNIVL